MEKIKKIIQLIMVSSGTTACTGCTGMCKYHTTNGDNYIKYGCTENILVPDLSMVYNIKIGLNAVSKNLGFFDASNDETNYDVINDSNNDSNNETNDEIMI